MRERVEVVDGVHIHIELEGLLRLVFGGALFLLLAALLVAARLLDIADVGAVLDRAKDPIPVMPVNNKTNNKTSKESFCSLM